MINRKSIDGERIHLKTLQTDSELNHYVDWLNDPLVNAYLDARFNSNTWKSVKNFIKAANSSQSEYLFGIFLREDGSHIGNIRIHSLGSEEHFGEIGILIGDRTYWGQGYATEAIALVVSFGRESLGVRRFGAGCRISNQGSVGAFQKVGFSIHETIKDGAKISDDVYEDVLRMTLEL
jgi:ribosomal-protein-alanine N-acetyltransferase